MYGEGGAPGTVPLHNLRVTSHVLHQEVPLGGGTEYVSFELFLGVLSGPGEGRGGAPGTVALQSSEVTSRKACLRNPDFPLLSSKTKGPGTKGPPDIAPKSFS